MNHEQHDKETCFEVTSDVLFVNGQVYLRGDIIRSSEIPAGLADMMMYGMILANHSKSRAAWLHILKSLKLRPSDKTC